MRTGSYTGECEWGKFLVVVVLCVQNVLTIRLTVKAVLQSKGKCFGLNMQQKICGIYVCCVNNKKLKHCGKCENLSCKRFDSLAL